MTHSQVVSHAPGRAPQKIPTLLLGACRGQDSVVPPMHCAPSWWKKTLVTYLGHQEAPLVPLPQALTSSAAVPWSHWVPMGSLRHSSRPRSHATNKPRTTQPQATTPGQQEQ